MSSTFEDALKHAHDMYVTGLRGQLKLPDDWSYHRTPYTADAEMEKLYALLGDDNYRVASGISRNGQRSVSIFISPEGMRRIIARRDQETPSCS